MYLSFCITSFKCYIILSSIGGFDLVLARDTRNLESTGLSDLFRDKELFSLGDGPSLRNTNTTTSAAAASTTPHLQTNGTDTYYAKNLPDRETNNSQNHNNTEHHISHNNTELGQQLNTTDLILPMTGGDSESYDWWNTTDPILPTTRGGNENYSWWKIVVTLVVFCSMAGVILYILRITENSNCKSRISQCCSRQRRQKHDDNEVPTLILPDDEACEHENSYL